MMSHYYHILAVPKENVFFRPRWNRQFSYQSAAQAELDQAIHEMPPLQVFTDVLRIDRTRKPIDNDSFADVEMWKEVIAKREKFDISAADVFHFFSSTQKRTSQHPTSVLVGGHHGMVHFNPFEVLGHTNFSKT